MNLHIRRAVLAALAAWSAAATATEHAVVVHGTTAAMERLHLGTANRVRDFGSYQWLRVDDAGLAALRASGLTIEEQPSANLVQGETLGFDPLSDAASRFRPGTTTADGMGLVLVQWDSPVTASRLDALRARGLEPLQYYPSNAYLAWGPVAATARIAEDDAVRWTDRFSVDFKQAPSLKSRVGRIDNVAVTFYNDGDIDGVVDQLVALGAEVLVVAKAQPDGRIWDATIRVDAAKLDAIAALPQVWAMGWQSPQPALEDEMSSQIIAGNYTGAGVPVTTPAYIPWLATQSFANLPGGPNGAGVRWAITDSGIDLSHPEFAGGRIVGGHTYPGCPAGNGLGDDPSSGGHGTHVAGIVGGAGIAVNGGGQPYVDAGGFRYGVGVAPQVGLVALNPICAGGTPWPPAGGWQELSKRALGFQAAGTNNSWTSGEGAGAGYLASARTHDFMVRDGDFDTPTTNEPFILVFSAGNSGPNASTITAPKELKNGIVVGSTLNRRSSGGSGNIEALSGFSSRGPARDGRRMPTVAAPGSDIASTRRVAGAAQCGTAIAGTDNRYSLCSGTSMASPHVAGAAVLLAQVWRDQNAPTLISPAMTKAQLVNGALDIADAAPVPNNGEGWGRINLPGSFARDRPMHYVNQTVLLSTAGETWERQFTVGDPTRPFKVTLAWTDAPAAVGANPTLVNDLDLEVIGGGQRYRGNVYTAGASTPGGTADRLDNIENVNLPSASGAMTVRVRAHNVPGDGVPNAGDTTDQDFALVCSNCSLVTSGYTLSASATAVAVCSPGSANLTLGSGSYNGFTSPITLTADGLPAGANAGFATNPLTPGTSTAVTLNLPAGLSAGPATAVLRGNAGGLAVAEPVALDISSGTPGVFAVTAPTIGQTGVSTTPTLSWAASPGATSYLVEVATDPGFANIVATRTVTGTSTTLATALAADTEHHWRVRATNGCGNTLATGNFRTVLEICRTPALAIPDGNATGVTDTMTAATAGALTDLDVSLQLNHTYLNDLTIRLVHVASNTTINLLARPTAGTGTTECSGNDINGILDDEATAAAQTSCVNAAVPALSGRLRPAAALTAFDTRELSGQWRLEVVDSISTDSGSVVRWCLQPTVAAGPANVIFDHGFE
jgi:hypothetical protein